MPRIGWFAIGTPQGSEFFEAFKQGLGSWLCRGPIRNHRAALAGRHPRSRAGTRARTAGAQGAGYRGPGSDRARRAQSIDSTPVVFGYSGDPVEAGLVNSFSRPGGNFTGATFMSYEVNAKRVELLGEAFPHVKRVAILSNPLHPGEQRELKESEQGAERLGIGVSYAKMRSVAEIELAFERIRAAGCRSHDRPAGWLVMQHRKRIIEFAALERIPAISGWSEFAKSGGTMTYGPNLKASFQRLAVYVDKILKGANPAELAVEQPTKFELVINLKAAKAIGLEVPAILLGRADEVIE